MNCVVEFLKNNNQALLLARNVNNNMTRLANEAELQERLDEAQATDKKLIEDFICAFCYNFPSDPIMYSDCEKVFCFEE